MNAEEYTRILRDIEKIASPFICEYCGTETSGRGAMCMCSNCESIVMTTRSILEKKDHVLLDSLNTINKDMADSKYGDALALYEKLIAERKEPQLMYAAAIAYLKYSNHEIMQIGYMRMGFMEENTMHRDKASKLVSSAKKLLARSISIANAEIGKGNRPLNLVYNRFLAQIKMNSIKGAKDSIEILSKIGNEYVYNYAQMVFDASRGKYDDTIRIAEKLVGEKAFSVNAYYYIGLALFKKRRFKDANTVLSALNSIVKSSNLEILIFEVNAQIRN